MEETKNVETEETKKVEEQPENKLDVEKMPDKERKKLLKSLIKENEDLKTSLQKAENEVKTVKDSWLRTAADFDNFKKRNSEIRSQSYRDGKADAIIKILVVGDNLDRALTMPLDDKTREGLEMTARQFAETLASMDVTAINPVGEPFDPQTQEAVMKMPAENGEVEGTVKQVFLKGYKLGDKVIRYAQVVVVG